MPRHQILRSVLVSLAIALTGFGFPPNPDDDPMYYVNRCVDENGCFRRIELNLKDGNRPAAQFSSFGVGNGTIRTCLRPVFALWGTRPAEGSSSNTLLAYVAPTISCGFTSNGSWFGDAIWLGACVKATSAFGLLRKTTHVFSDQPANVNTPGYNRPYFFVENHPACPGMCIRYNIRFSPNFYKVSVTQDCTMHIDVLCFPLKNLATNSPLCFPCPPCP